MTLTALLWLIWFLKIKNRAKRQKAWTFLYQAYVIDVAAFNCLEIITVNHNTQLKRAMIHRTVK